MNPKKGLDVECATLESSCWFSHYEVVEMFDAIEHLPNPRNIDKAYSLLSNGGSCYDNWRYHESNDPNFGERPLAIDDGRRSICVFCKNNGDYVDTTRFRGAICDPSLAECAVVAQLVSLSAAK